MTSIFYIFYSWNPSQCLTHIRSFLGEYLNLLSLNFPISVMTINILSGPNTTLLLRNSRYLIWRLADKVNNSKWQLWKEYSYCNPKRSHNSYYYYRRSVNIIIYPLVFVQFFWVIDGYFYFFK